MFTLLQFLTITVQQHSRDMQRRLIVTSTIISLQQQHEQMIYQKHC